MTEEGSWEEPDTDVAEDGSMPDVSMFCKLPPIDSTEFDFEEDLRAIDEVKGEAMLKEVGSLGTLGFLLGFTSVQVLWSPGRGREAGTSACANIG